MIIIGRRSHQYPSRFQALRKEFFENEGIEIISYDTLVERIEQRWSDYYVKVFSKADL